MSPTGVFVLDGVIRKPNTETIIRQGISLFRAVSPGIRTAILGTTDKERDEWFLKANNLIPDPDIYPLRVTEGATLAERRLAQIARVRAIGANVEFVVEPDPEIAAHLMDQGVPVLLFLSPQYSHPDFRPDAEREAKPWDQLRATVDYQTALRVGDNRLSEEPE